MRTLVGFVLVCAVILAGGFLVAWLGTLSGFAILGLVLVGVAVIVGYNRTR